MVALKMLTGTGSSELVAKIMPYLFSYFLVQSSLVLSQRVMDTLGHSPALLKHSDFCQPWLPSLRHRANSLEAQSRERHSNSSLQSARSSEGNFSLPASQCNCITADIIWLHVLIIFSSNTKDHLSGQWQGSKCLLTFNISAKSVFLQE